MKEEQLPACQISGGHSQPHASHGDRLQAGSEMFGRPGLNILYYAQIPEAESDAVQALYHHQRPGLADLGKQGPAQSRGKGADDKQ